jgi:hypothetical protein
MTTSELPGRMPDTESAEFLAAVWQFIADVRDGTATDSPASFDYARWLVGFIEGAAVEFYEKMHGVTTERAEAAFDELVRSQSRLYASLAAG